MAERAATDAKVRLFFAALPDSATRRHITAASASLQLEAAARFVPGENYHVTLAFVGAVAAAQVPTVRQIGKARQIAAFTLRFDVLEYWSRAAAVVAATPVIVPSLNRLWRELLDELAQQGYRLDSASFRPHVTLARKVSQAPVLQALAPFDWTVREFCLMSSETTGAQSAYTVVDTWPLLDNPTKT